MHGNILVSLILFLKICYLVIAAVQTREMELQLLQDFKWLTKEDAASCKKPKKTANEPKVKNEGSAGISLGLVNIVFPDKSLTNEWLKSPCYITALKISRSNLGIIETDAFNTEIFSELVELRIRYSDIWLIKRGAFNGLTKLRQLTLDSLGLDGIGKDVLLSCPKLKQIHIYFSFDTEHPIHNKWFSSSEFMNELEMVYLYGNEIRKGIDDTTFNATANINILSMRDNYIETIGNGAFKPIKNLKFLDLTKNCLKTMPSELKNLITNKPSIKFELGDNPWVCNCEMEAARVYYLQNETPYPIICEGGMHIKNCMDLCSEDTICLDLKTTPEIRLPFWHQKSLTKHVTSVKCKAPKVSIVLKRPTKRFLIGQYLDGDYFINLSGFTSEQIIVVLEVGIYGTTENSTCITNNRNVQTDYMQFSTKLRSNTSYLLCLLDKGTSSIRPLNCFSFHSKHEETNTSNNIWIFNKDRNIMFFLCILSGLISISLGIALALITPKLRALFPKNDDETLINQSCYIENRPPLRRKRRVAKLRSKPKSYHPELHQINGRSMSMLLSSGVSTPITKSVNRCCDSENCQCYCEILMD